ncbi:MAG: hydrogenase iron-sulfur subunit [Armatimonadetes bacterium]|nr:hydrogenase iron-sulfur subunit [Armatimonadota bacterium]
MYEPKIMAFFCNWCTYAAADLAGVSRLSYPPNVKIIRVMCSGRVDPQFILQAFHAGADGVVIGGCHPEQCHYQEGNYKTLRRAKALKRLLVQMGIEQERFRLVWISASEGDLVQKTMREMTETLRALGPLHLTRPEGFEEELAMLRESSSIVEGQPGEKLRELEVVR